MTKTTELQGRAQASLINFPVIGIVVDNEDPNGWGRVKVRFPTLGADVQSDWLRQVSPQAGSGHGFYALPEVDDEVLVMFMHGDPSVGVILGQLWNGVDKPPAEASEMPDPEENVPNGAKFSTQLCTRGDDGIGGNSRRLWRSRSGHVLAFDDSDGAESVQIWDKDSNLSLIFDTSTRTIFLAASDGDIHIRAGGAMFLEAGDDLSLHAGGKIIGTSGGDTTLEVDGDLSVQSMGKGTLSALGALTVESTGGNLVCKGAINTTLEGTLTTLKGSATAKIQGGAMTEIKGGMVTIN